jgi:hypothetical protein
VLITKVGIHIRLKNKDIENVEKLCGKTGSHFRSISYRIAISGFAIFSSYVLCLALPLSDARRLCLSMLYNYTFVTLNTE